ISPSYATPICFLPALFRYDQRTTSHYTLSLHDALPISWSCRTRSPEPPAPAATGRPARRRPAAHAAATGRLIHSGHASPRPPRRSEEHTSELQSRENLVCRLLLEKKKKTINKECYTINL